MDNSILFYIISRLDIILNIYNEIYDLTFYLTIRRYIDKLYYLKLLI